MILTLFFIGFVAAVFASGPFVRFVLGACLFCVPVAFAQGEVVTGLVAAAVLIAYVASGAWSEV